MLVISIAIKFKLYFFLNRYFGFTLEHLRITAQSHVDDSKEVVKKK